MRKRGECQSWYAMLRMSCAQKFFGATFILKYEPLQYLVLTWGAAVARLGAGSILNTLAGPNCCWGSGAGLAGGPARGRRGRLPCQPPPYEGFCGFF